MGIKIESNLTNEEAFILACKLGLNTSFSKGIPVIAMAGNKTVAASVRCATDWKTGKMKDPESAMRLAIQMAAEKIQSGDDKYGS